MPIFDYECEECGKTFESIEVWKSHSATACKHCGSAKIKKVIGSSSYNIRMDSDSILKSMPDPQPPLEELRGKNKPGTTGGYSDKPEASQNLNNYTRSKDKHGNTIWREKKRLYFT